MAEAGPRPTVGSLSLLLRADGGGELVRSHFLLAGGRVAVPSVEEGPEDGGGGAVREGAKAQVEPAHGAQHGLETSVYVVKI